MELKQYIDYIAKDFDDNSPFGKPVSRLAEFDFIDTQLMKVGSLSHEEINWDDVESKCVYLLGSIGKDFKVMSALTQTLQYNKCIVRFNLSIVLLSIFINQYWETPYPFKGKRGEQAKLKLLDKIIKRTIKSFDGMRVLFVDNEDIESLTNALHELEKAYKKHELSLDGLIEIKGWVKQINENNKDESAIDDQSVEKEKQDNSTTVIELETKIFFDKTNERNLKKTLGQIASFFSELDQRYLALKVRRLALWSTINTAPDCNEDGETELAAIPSDLASDYKEAIAHADLFLWEKVETSISKSPYWLEGHYISALIAEKLGYIDEAKLIKEELKLFLEKIPKLETLFFKGKSPFLPEVVAEWLRKIQVSDQLENAQNVAETPVFFSTDLQKNVIEKLNEIGLDQTIRYVNDGLEQACSLREQCYWQLALANIYQKIGLFALEKAVYEDLAAIVENIALKDWEPGLFTMLCIYTKS